MSPKIMGALSGTHEIVELTEKHDPDSKIIKNTGNHPPLKKKHKIEDDINKLFEAIEIGRGVGQQERRLRDSLNKSAMKRPMRVSPSQVSSIGISEQLSLKQALRGLCISQASEMAAVKKRMSRPSLASPAVSESGAIKKLYRTVVVELEGSQRPLDEVKQNLVEISLVPERDGSFSVGSELLEASKDFSSSEENARAQNVVKKRTFVAKNQTQHSKGAKKDGDDHSNKMVHHTRDPISETGCDVKKDDEWSRSKEITVSQSSKSSIGEYSSTTTSYSEESSYLSGSSRSGYRPHMSKDLRWEAIRSFQKQNGNLGLRHFKLLRKIGGGDIGMVYLSELIGTSCLFAVKVMDNEFLVSRKKMIRAQTEKEILEILDHPFLPTLYAHFMTNKFSCLVMEYCPGGDLHVLRQKQLTKSFPEKAARFYVAEVLLALEYLHMLGVVYRDLKPENILVREDGHIMLSDFDLSLRCAVNPMLIKSSSPVVAPTKKMPSPCSDSTTCMDPFCLQPSWQLSCFTPRFLSAASKTRKLKSEPTNQVISLPQLVVEPTSARSNSFVGTHEYLAPEIIKGEGHGSAVDWWTLGIFLYELLYGRTPFKGSTNEETVSNVVSECLKFPQCPTVGSHARDLIGRLLKKEPESRMGSTKGAAEIKGHSFFDGVNWALVRCETPPEIPKLYDLANVVVCESKMSKLPVEFGSRGDEVEFEMF